MHIMHCFRNPGGKFQKFPAAAGLDIMPAGMYLQVIRSGSRGNAALVWTDEDALVIEAGTATARATRKAMEALGLSADQTRGILVTHCHTDHLHPDTLWALKLECPVVTHTDTWEAMKRRYTSVLPMDLAPVQPHKKKKLGSFRVTPFPVPHDAPGRPMGYRIECGRRTLVYVTDLGHVPRELLPIFSDCDLLVIESDHDPTMELNSGRDMETIKRNLGDLGHLSNEQCAEALEWIYSNGKRVPHTVVLAHLSLECNRKELALELASRAVKSRARVLAADQYIPTEVLEV